jgi:hypothetical protein
MRCTMEDSNNSSICWVIWWSGNPYVLQLPGTGVLDPGKGCLGLMDGTDEGRTDDAVPSI